MIFKTYELFKNFFNNTMDKLVDSKINPDLSMGSLNNYILASLSDYWYITNYRLWLKTFFMCKKYWDIGASTLMRKKINYNSLEYQFIVKSLFNKKFMLEMSCHKDFQEIERYELLQRYFPENIKIEYYPRGATGTYISGGWNNSAVTQILYRYRGSRYTSHGQMHGYTGPVGATGCTGPVGTTGSTGTYDSDTISKFEVIIGPSVISTIPSLEMVLNVIVFRLSLLYFTVNGKSPSIKDEGPDKRSQFIPS